MVSWAFIGWMGLVVIVLVAIAAVTHIDIVWLGFAVVIMRLYCEYKHHDYEYYKKYYEDHEPDWRDNPPR